MEGASWLVCPRATAGLERLDAVIAGALVTPEPSLADVAGGLIARGGKRLRPALTLLAGGLGEAVGQTPGGMRGEQGTPGERSEGTERAEQVDRIEDEPLLRAAAALELVHVASLYHDDVLDRAPVRRGAPSANALLGNEAATALGTFLFARACMLIATLGDAANQLASAAFSEICAGELQEVENAFNLELTEEEHLEILARKTGALFELPCRLGAYLGGVDGAWSAVLARYGRHLGLAFQLADDALDLIGSAATMGKDTGTDLREGVYSLAVVRALRAGGAAAAELRGLLLRLDLHDPDGAAAGSAIRLIVESGAVHGAMATARDQAHRALAALRDLPAGEARQSLANLAAFAVERAA